MIEELILKNRSCRRYIQDRPVTETTLRSLVDLARLSASAANLQPLKYVLSCDGKKNDTIFRTLRWAGYLKEWKGPAVGERPAAYIIIVGDTEITRSFGCDHGIAAQSILLGAVERGLAGCMVASIDRDMLRNNLRLETRYEILLAVALGYSGEKIVLEKIAPSGDIKYWRDGEGAHHVPKRPLDEIIVDR